MRERHVMRRRLPVIRPTITGAIAVTPQQPAVSSRSLRSAPAATREFNPFANPQWLESLPVASELAESVSGCGPSSARLTDRADTWRRKLLSIVVVLGLLVALAGVGLIIHNYVTGVHPNVHAPQAQTIPSVDDGPVHAVRVK